MPITKHPTLASFLAVEATYYGPEDAEELSCEDLEEYVNSVYDYDMAGEEPQPLLVCAWVRQVVSPNCLAAWSMVALDGLLDSFDEQYNGRDADPTEPTQAHKDAMAAAVGTIVGTLDVWCCDAVAIYELTASEVAGMLDTESSA